MKEKSFYYSTSSIVSFQLSNEQEKNMFNVILPQIYKNLIRGGSGFQKAKRQTIYKQTYKNMKSNRSRI